MIFFAASSTSLAIYSSMPRIFANSDVDKFKKRAHRFILFGLIPTAFTLYLGMVLAFSPLIAELAYFVAGLPFAFVYVLYRMRK